MAKNNLVPKKNQIVLIKYAMFPDKDIGLILNPIENGVYPIYFFESSSYKEAKIDYVGPEQIAELGEIVDFEKLVKI